MSGTNVSTKARITRTALRCVSILGLLILLPSPSFACSCAAQPELESALEKSSIVFIGRVVEQRATPFKKGQTEVKMTVFKRFKGFEDVPESEYLLVYTPDNEGACGVKFQNGFEYLVFAGGTPAFFTVSSCSRTQLLDNAMLDQQRLIRMTAPKN